MAKKVQLQRTRYFEFVVNTDDEHWAIATAVEALAQDSDALTFAGSDNNFVDIWDV